MADRPQTTLGEMLRDARARLSEAGVDDPGLEARMLVEHFTGTNRTNAITSPDRPVGLAAVEAIQNAIARRAAGEPVHRILGFREFYGLELLLSSTTLEPRPDTETLVDAMLPYVRQTAARTGACRILDLGTGAGAIALALLSQVETAVATGVDISENALDTAARNAGRLRLGERFTPLLSDWFSNIFGRFDVIVSNPPYIPRKDIDGLQADVRNFDPLIALDGGDDGLDAYRLIAAKAPLHVEIDGTIGVEIGFDQISRVADIFRQAGCRLIKVEHDLAGNDRVLVFKT